MLNELKHVLTKQEKQTIIKLQVYPLVAIVQHKDVGGIINEKN